MRQGRTEIRRLVTRRRRPVLDGVLFREDGAVVAGRAVRGVAGGRRWPCAPGDR